MSRFQRSLYAIALPFVRTGNSCCLQYLILCFTCFYFSIHKLQHTAEIVTEFFKITGVAGYLIACTRMSVDKGCILIKLVYPLIQYLYPAFHIGAGAAVNKRMTAVKYQVAAMNNIGMFKMNKAI